MCYCFETCVGFLVLMISLMNKSRWLICWFKESTITVWRKHGNNFKQTKMHHLLIWFLFTGWFNRMTNTSTIRIRCMLGPTVLYTCVYTWIPNFFVFLYFIKESKHVTIFTSKYIDISYQTYSLDTSIQLKIKSSLHWKTRFVYINVYIVYAWFGQLFIIGVDLGKQEDICVDYHTCYMALERIVYWWLLCKQAIVHQVKFTTIYSRAKCSLVPLDYRRHWVQRKPYFA